MAVGGGSGGFECSPTESQTGWQSRLILLTIRSNLFRAKSSLKVSGGPTSYQQGVAAAVTLPSGGALHYYYTRLTDSGRCNTSDGLPPVFVALLIIEVRAFIAAPLSCLLILSVRKAGR